MCEQEALRHGEEMEVQQIMQIVRDSAFASGKIWLRLRHQLPEDFLD